MRVCVCVCGKERQRESLWITMPSSSGVLPVDIITCAEISAVSQTHKYNTHTHAHTHTSVTFKLWVSVKKTVSRSNAALYLDDAATESDAAWHQHMAVSQVNCPTPVFMFEPADSKEHSDTSWYIVTLYPLLTQEDVGKSVSTEVMEIMMSPWKQFPLFLLEAETDL